MQFCDCAAWIRLSFYSRDNIISAQNRSFAILSLFHVRNHHIHPHRHQPCKLHMIKRYAPFLIHANTHVLKRISASHPHRSHVLNCANGHAAQQSYYYTYTSDTSYTSYISYTSHIFYYTCHIYSKFRCKITKIISPTQIFFQINERRSCKKRLFC